MLRFTDLLLCIYETVMIKDDGAKEVILRSLGTTCEDILRSFKGRRKSFQEITHPQSLSVFLVTHHFWDSNHSEYDVLLIRP